MGVDKLKGRLSPVQTLRGSLSDKTQSVTGQIANRGGVIKDHQYLEGRDRNDQHPISAITGLKEALENITIPAIVFDLVVDEGLVQIDATTSEIKEAVESGNKVVFSQESEDGMMTYDLIGADWEAGSIVLQNIEGGVISTAQLSEIDGSMVGDMRETTLINSETEFIIYCGTATEVI